MLGSDRYGRTLLHNGANFYTPMISRVTSCSQNPATISETMDPDFFTFLFIEFFVCFNLVEAVFSTKASSIEINNTFWENSRWIASELVAGFREQDSKKIRLRSQKAVGPTVSSNAHFHLIWHVTKLYACSFPSEIRLQLRFCFHDWEISWLVEHGDICRKLLRWKQKGDVR